MPKRQYVWNILFLIGLALFFGLLARQAKRYFREQFEREAYEVHIRKMREGNSPDVNYPTFEEHRHGLPRFEWTMASDRKKPRELNPQELQKELRRRCACELQPMCVREYQRQ